MTQKIDTNLTKISAPRVNFSKTDKKGRFLAPFGKFWCALLFKISTYWRQPRTDAIK